MSLDFKALAEPKRPKRKGPEGYAIVVFAHGMGWCVAWEAIDGVEEFMLDSGASHEGFSFEDVSMDHAPLADGIWVGEIRIADDGPGDWEGSREYLPTFENERLATVEEWRAFLGGDVPWEALSEAGEGEGTPNASGAF